VVDVYSGGCKWLPSDDYKDNINSLIKCQRIARNYLKRKKLDRLIPHLIEIYYTPGMKGAYFHKKAMEEWLNKEFS